MTIYDIPKIISTALPLAATPSNIIAGFRVTGISPFNSEIFDDSEFLAGYSTDRPEEKTVTSFSDKTVSNYIVEPLEGQDDDGNVAGTSCEFPVVTRSTHDDTTEDISAAGPSRERESTPPITPLQLRPLPKAGPRKNSKTSRRKRNTAILTDTPIKNELMEQQNSAKKAKTVKKKIMEETPKQKPKSRSQKSKRINHDDDGTTDSEKEESAFCLYCTDSFKNSLPGEGWIQCTDCKMWAHIKCAGDVNEFFVCPNCESD